MTELVLGPGRVDGGTKQLVARASSVAAGCAYRQAHTAHAADKLGARLETIGGCFDTEISRDLSEPEAAALRLARDAATAPSQVTDSHFEELRKHYDVDQILEIMAVISLFGWLNRWNQMLATELEAVPLRFARANLAARGWHPGPHVR